MITCYFENKNRAELRHTVVDALVISRGKLLLVKRSKNSISNPNKYALPGGFLDRDENTTEAVLREVWEETGYKGKIVSLFEVIDRPERKEDRQNVGFVYLVKVDEKSGKEDLEEISDVLWFDLNKLPKESEMGFDHLEIIELYKKHLKKPQQLPIIIS